MFHSFLFNWIWYLVIPREFSSTRNEIEKNNFRVGSSRTSPSPPARERERVGCKLGLSTHTPAWLRVVVWANSADTLLHIIAVSRWHSLFSLLYGDANPTQFDQLAAFKTARRTVGNCDLTRSLRASRSNNCDKTETRNRQELIRENQREKKIREKSSIKLWKNVQHSR